MTPDTLLVLPPAPVTYVTWREGTHIYRAGLAPESATRVDIQTTDGWTALDETAGYVELNRLRDTLTDTLEYLDSAGPCDDCGERRQLDPVWTGPHRDNLLGYFCADCETQHAAKW